jgi:signal transduction histidine kinase
MGLVSRLGALRLRGMSVRSKLILVAATPILVAGGLLLALFFWGHAATARAYEDAIAWERHSRALQNLDWAVRFYLDSVSDRVTQDALPHSMESAKALVRSRAEALGLAKHFDAAEYADEERLDDHLRELIDEGERVGHDPAHLRVMEAKFHDVIGPEIRARVADEEEGSERAIRAANALSHNMHVGGIAIAVLALLGAIGAAMVAVRRFGGRVASLEATAARVAAGHLEGELPVTSSDELGRLAGSLNAMVAALRSQRARQLEFLAAVAHDLKNPLGVMHLSTEMLVQKADLPQPVRNKSIALIHRQIARLRRMVDDLLDASVIEAGALKLALQACDLAAVARNVVELYEESSPRHALRLAVPAEPATAICDPTRIAQVLDNLVNNAIKYSPAGGTIDVIITADADAVDLAVQDTGPGIDPSMREVIFEPFRRGAPSKDVVPGVGLGLSTCRRIAVAHGGRIEVSSEPGRGATFRVHLPRRLAAAAAASAPAREAPGA